MVALDVLCTLRKPSFVERSRKENRMKVRYKQELHHMDCPRIWREERCWILKEHKVLRTRTCRWCRKRDSKHACCTNRENVGSIKEFSWLGWPQKTFFALSLYISRCRSQHVFRYSAKADVVLYALSASQECGESVRTLKALVATPLSLSLTPRPFQLVIKLRKQDTREYSASNRIIRTPIIKSINYSL